MHSIPLLPSFILRSLDWKGRLLSSSIAGMGLSLSYLAAAAAVIVVAVSMASKAKQKKAEALAATNVSQTGQEMTQLPPEEEPLKTGIDDSAPPPPKSTKSTTKSAVKPAKKAFDYTIPPEFRAIFGLSPHDPADPWKPKPLSKRLTESILTEAEATKYRGFLKDIFSDETVGGKRIVFDPFDVAEVMKKIVEYIWKDPTLIDDVPYDITVVSDLHGQLYDLDRVFRYDAKDGKPGWECMKYLFLGDYVDRGRQSLEIVMGLFCIKMLYPDRIFLLKGNHEFMGVNSRYGFYNELWDRYNVETAKTLYHVINCSFGYLSVAAIVGGKYFCAHGGISQTGFTRRQINALVKPLHFCTEDQLLMDLVWSEPAEGLQGTSFNLERCTSHYFGLDTLSHALYNVDCLVLIRGHTFLPTGYKILGNMVINIFTATGNAGQETDHGAVAYLSATGKLKIIMLKASMKRIDFERTMKQLDGRDGAIGEAVTERDEKTVMSDREAERKELAADVELGGMKQM